jgi:hypothetical protein
MKLPVIAAGAILLLAGIVLGPSSTSPVSAQNQPASSATVGRYQMSLSVHPGGGVTSTTVFVLDTATGQCWYRETAGSRPWTDHGSPVVDAKK